MRSRKLKVIFDTNVWISFLIGRRLGKMKQDLAAGKIQIVYCEQLILEIRMVTEREKLRKYFPKESVEDMISLLEVIGEKVQVKKKYTISRDPKDDFLFDLIHCSRADFLVTGDKLLLTHSPFQTAQIISPNAFEKLL